MQTRLFLPMLLLVNVVLFSSATSAQQSMLENVMKNTSESSAPDTAATTSSGLNISGLIGQLTSKLNVSEEQAQGGVASIMNYAKQNLSSGDFSSLAEKIPGTDGILKHLPELKGAGDSNMGGLLSKAADKLGGTALLAKQFESLGLQPDMVMGFVSQIQGYLDTEGGQQAKALLTNGLGGLVK